MSNQEQRLSQETFLRLSNLARTIRNRALEHPDDESAMDTYKDADEFDALLHKFITELIVEGHIPEVRTKAEVVPRPNRVQWWVIWITVLLAGCLWLQADGGRHADERLPFVILTVGALVAWRLTVRQRGSRLKDLKLGVKKLSTHMARVAVLLAQIAGLLVAGTLCVFLAYLMFSGNPPGPGAPNGRPSTIADKVVGLTLLLLPLLLIVLWRRKVTNPK